MPCFNHPRSDPPARRRRIAPKGRRGGDGGGPRGTVAEVESPQAHVCHHVHQHHQAGEGHLPPTDNRLSNAGWRPSLLAASALSSASAFDSYSIIFKAYMSQALKMMLSHRKSKPKTTQIQPTMTVSAVRYTGHCPTLKFRIGKRYGASTQEIIREMGERGVWAKRMLESHYRQVDPLKGLLEGGDFRRIEKTKGQVNPPAGRSKRYILGYTGFIPGMNFSYGKSYANLAEESFDKFNVQRRAALERKKVGDLSWRAKARGTQKLPDTYPHDKLNAALLDYEERNRYRDEHISPEQPPIAGYTGHIPRIKSSEASLSQRYHEAAKRGLYLLQQDRERLRTMEGISRVPYQTPVY